MKNTPSAESQVALDRHKSVNPPPVTSAATAPDQGKAPGVAAVAAGSAKARETLLALANFNSWRRGDEALEMPDPAEIGAAIDDAVNLLRRYDDMERESTRLREALQSLAYLSRDRTQTRITLRDRIAAILSQNAKLSHDQNGEPK